jgi:hypothetical protein
MMRVKVSEASKCASRENQMPGFGGDQRGFDGFQIAHFADQNHVRVLAQRAAQGFGKRARVNVDFALRDKGFFVFVEKFNRVFDRHDVRIARLIDVIDHRRKRRRFARTGRSRDQNQAALFVGDTVQNRRQPESAEIANVSEMTRATMPMEFRC